MDYLIIGLMILIGWFIFFKPVRGWIIGPIIRGTSLSKNMPRTPTPLGVGWTFDFPQDGHVHSVQNFGAKPRVGIKVRFRIEGVAKFRNQSGERGTVTIMIQRKGDKWIERFDRWFFKESFPLKEGVHEIHASFLAHTWLSEDGVSNSDHLPEFLYTLKHLGNVSLFFGGVYSDSPAKFILESYQDL